MTCGIYKLTFPSGKVYIGQSINIEGRWIEHKQDHKNCNNQKYKLKNITKLRSSYKKYPWDKISKDIIEICLPEWLNAKEIYYISVNDSFTNGLNGTSGGNQDFKRSKETKEKLRLANLGKYGGSQAIPFYIDNVKYVSILEASVALKIPHKTIHNRLNSTNIKYSNYIYEDSSLVPIRHKRKTKPVVGVKIDGIVYESAAEASMKFSISHTTILRRCRSKSKKFKNYELA